MPAVTEVVTSLTAAPPSPKLILACLAVVAPVPPLAIESVPVIVLWVCPTSALLFNKSTTESLPILSSASAFIVLALIVVAVNLGTLILAFSPLHTTCSPYKST